MIGHGGRRGKHAVGADEIRTQTQPLAGETDRLLVVSTDELAVRSNPIVDRGKGVPRAQAQRLARVADWWGTIVLPGQQTAFGLFLACGITIFTVSADSSVRRRRTICEIEMSR